MPQITSKQINVQQPCRRLSDHIFTIFFLDTWENKTFWDGILAALGDILSLFKDQHLFKVILLAAHKKKDNLKLAKDCNTQF